MTAPSTENRDRRSDGQDVARLREALRNGDLSLSYQPIHDLATGRVASVEALLRWEDDAKRKVNIEEMTSAAERGEEIFGLADWVTRTAVAESLDWPRSEPPVRIGINVSARHFQEGDPARFFNRMVNELGLDPSRFSLELTEKSFIRKPEEVVDLLDQLKAAGFQLWLDDFGTGHSSIEHLKYFPVDGLKIPATYTAEMLNDDRSGAIVRAMISVAKSLGILVVAEGIEKREQLDFIKAAGCDRVQGFIFSEALEADDAAAYIRRVNG